MARYQDSWVLNKTLYEEMLQGGSCLCVSGTNSTTSSFLPFTSLDTLMTSVSDVEKEEIEGEKLFHQMTFSNNSPATNVPKLLAEDFWRDVWVCRIQLRLRIHRDFIQFHPYMSDEALFDWFHHEWRIHELQDFFQITKVDVIRLLRDEYKLGEHRSLDIFLPAILEQMEYFHLTRYSCDSRGTEELDFEKVLHMDADKFFLSLSTDNMPWILNIFIRRMKSFGVGPILNSGDKSRSLLMQPGPSFRYDRRIIRLVVAKFWVDGIMERWNHSNTINR